MANHPGLAHALCAALLIPVATGAAAAQAQAPTQARVPADLRNVRYCEVITLQRRGLSLEARVYNTLGLNFCPEDKWAALDAKALAKQLNVTAVKLNGPRYWTLDSITASGATASGHTKEFGGIAMTQRATLELRLRDARARAYKVNTVNRETVWNYKGGQPVYELVSPKGDVYVMQSYAQIVDPKLTIDELATLDQRLKLPKGWTYRTRMLDADYALKTNGTAYVVQDELQNSYQRRTK